MPMIDRARQIVVPFYFKCPISLELMRDPVSLSTGITYDRASIEKWLDDGNKTCPATRQVLDNRELTPNHTLRRLIQEWCVANRSMGVERIPTPRPPADPHQVRLMLEDISEKDNQTPAVLKSLRALAKASERNRRCIEGEGAIPILVNLLDLATKSSDCESVEVSQDALGTLVLFDLDGSTKRILLDTKLDAIRWLLNSASSIDARVNAALLLESLCINRSAILNICSNARAMEGLLALLKCNLYHTAVKASLKTLVAICMPGRIRVKLVEMQAIPALIELLPDADRSMTERIMALLDALSSCAEGRVAITEHALGIAAIIKSILLVSDLTSEHAVCALWSLCHNSAQIETLQEVIQFGAFKKLLVLVQMDTTPRTKRRTKELLKLLTEVSGDPSCGRHSSSEEI